MCNYKRNKKLIKRLKNLKNKKKIITVLFSKQLVATTFENKKLCIFIATTR